jgi:hypothetical protein
MIAFAINNLPQPLPLARQIGPASHPANYPAGAASAALQASRFSAPPPRT